MPAKTHVGLTKLFSPQNFGRAIPAYIIMIGSAAKGVFVKCSLNSYRSAKVSRDTVIILFQLQCTDVNTTKSTIQVPTQRHNSARIYSLAPYPGPSQVFNVAHMQKSAACNMENLDCAWDRV